MTYKIKGVNSDTDTCSKCGKTNLKKVVWLESETTEPAPFGVNCAARLLSNRKSVSASKAIIIVNDELIKAIHSKIRSILESDNFILVRSMNCHLPKDLGRLVMSGKMAPAEAMKERKERYPILAYQANEISFDEACKYL